MKNLLSYDEFIKEEEEEDHIYFAKHLINRTPIMDLDKGKYLSKKKIKYSKLLLNTAKYHIDKIK